MTRPGGATAFLLLLILGSRCPDTALAQVTMVNGGNHSGALLSAEATNTWSFEVTSGNRIILRIGSQGFSPRLDLSTQQGLHLGSAFADSLTNRDAMLSIQATNTGVYTVQVRSQIPEGIGSYELHLVRIPSPFIVPAGDEGGALPNGAANAGAITLGDLDPWSFPVNAGDRILLRMGTTNFTPRVDLYDPIGVLVGSTSIDDPLSRDLHFSISATNTGVYTVVASSHLLGGSGGYGLHLARIPGGFIVSEGDQGGVLTNGFRYYGTNELGDLDLWRFRGTIGDSNALQIIATNFTPWLRLYDPVGTLVGEAFTADPTNREALLRYVVKTNGTHVLVESAYLAGQSGTYTLRQLRVPPDLEIETNTQVLIENDSLTLPMSAQDPDQPDKPLLFSLVSGPSEAVVTQLGDTNAAIAWTPGEADGPGTNRIIVGVTDVVNGTAFLGTNSFLVIVNESNRPPVFPVQTNLTVNELTLLSVPIVASDPDIPGNTLTFALLAGPTNATFSPAGVLTWTPAETQGPGTNDIVVMVSDTNPAAINEKLLRATNTVTVVVNEVNSAPVLEPMTDRSINPGQTIQFTAVASDADEPANLLSFDLINPPPGATITSSGLFNWRPAATQAGTTNLIQIRVQDNGVPSFNDLAPFITVVNPLAPVVLSSPEPTNGVFRFRIDGTTGPDYVIMSSTTVTHWSDLATNFSPATPFEFSDLNAGSNSNRMYRIRLEP